MKLPSKAELEKLRMENAFKPLDKLMAKQAITAKELQSLSSSIRIPSSKNKKGEVNG